MDKNEISRGTHASVLSTNNRQLFWARFLLLVLFLAVSLASLQPRASAQAANKATRGNEVGITSHQLPASSRNCPACQQAYVECIANGGTNCTAQYYACLENCF